MCYDVVMWFFRASRFGSFRRRLSVALLAWAAAALPASAQSPQLDELLSAVVRVTTFIHPDARTAENLGSRRQGSGILIDEKGLVLTIGYLMVEAFAAEVHTNDGRTMQATVVGYDHETGFGLLKTTEPPQLKPMMFGKSSDLKERDQVLAASFGGVRGVAPAYVVARREFAGNWEYLIDAAIFTAPAHNEWSGAALINREGKLVGVGSLIVNDATGKGDGVPGNMYVPTDLLAPILADLVAKGRQKAAKPWLGVTTGEVAGRLLVARVAPGGPAEKAGIHRGDIIVGVAGEPTKTMAEFYRKVWARGAAGTTIPLDVLQNESVRRIDVQSADRLDHLKINSTF
jgi:serine protease Do